MARKSRNPNFDQALEVLRAHSFEVVPFAGVAGGMLVSKGGAAAVLVAAPANDGGVGIYCAPGGAGAGRSGSAAGPRLPEIHQDVEVRASGTAGQLEAMHRFGEELKQLTGAVSLYNESLGTTSDLYQLRSFKGTRSGAGCGCAALGTGRRALILSEIPAE